MGFTKRNKVIKQIPRLLGTELRKTGKFWNNLLSKDDDMREKIGESIFRI